MPSRRPVVALALAEAISLSGTRLSMIAIPWLVLTLTGDPLLTGLAGFAEMLPYVIAKALGGPLIDRLGARRIAITGDLASMAAIALVPVLLMGGILGIATILPLVAVLGGMRGPADAAKTSMIPAVAAKAHLPLSRVTGMMGVIERLASTVGAAAAGALVALVGPAPALAVTALTFAASALTVAIALPAAPLVSPSSSGYLADLREGWRWFRRDIVLVGFVLTIASTNFLDAAYGTVLLPVWSEMRGDAALLGLLLATMSGASIVGSALATAFAERLPRLLVYVVAYLVTGAPRYLIFAVDSPLAAILMAVATAGFASGFLNPIISAVIFERIPVALTGRVSSLVNALCWTLIPLGGLAGGALILLIGLPATFATMGIAYVAATFLPLAIPAFRTFAQRAEIAAQPKPSF